MYQAIIAPYRREILTALDERNAARAVPAVTASVGIG
jgi:hypothetical protein